MTRIGLLGSAAALVLTAIGVSLGAGRVQAAPDRLRLIELTDGGGHVLEAYDIAPPGLAAWKVDVTYDSSIVELTGCNGQKDMSICGPHLAENTARVSGSSDTGLSNSVVLATFFFECLRSGDAEITFGVSVWAHAGPDGPVEADVEFDESFAFCGEPRTPPPDGTATPPPPTATAPPGLPPTGAGPSDNANAALWPLALLAAAGASFLALAAVRKGRA